MAREFSAPRQLVWREWTEPVRFADWFGGPGTEVPLSTVSLDVRPGGAWCATTLAYGPERRDICWRGEYLEVAEPKRLVFTLFGLFDEPAPDIVTVVLEDIGQGRTKMLFRQRGQRPAEQYERAKAGWFTEFDRMGETLSSPDPMPRVV